MDDVAPARAERRSLVDAPVRVVSARAPLLTRLRNLTSRRELLTGFIVSDIRIKYKGSALGLLWSMISPALTLVVYFMVFSVVLKSGIPNFVIYLACGLVVWNMFQTAVSSATGVIVERSGLVKKVSFPREILALSNVGSSVIYFGIQLLVIAIFLAIIKHAPAWGDLWLLPISFVALYLLTASVAIVMSAVTVYLRDVKHLMDVVLQLWFWLTPVVYSYEHSISAPLHRHGLTWLYFLNPLTLIVLTFQRVIYVQTSALSTTQKGLVIHVLPTWPIGTYLDLNLLLIGIAAVLFLVAETIFGRLEGNFESEL
ncbi:MAG TPA: ABC transporter permease [Acidimicrobiales bacterium]|nr:ABC transporter permease [Acidimicrobiales bacterium]